LRKENDSLEDERRRDMNGNELQDTISKHQNEKMRLEEEAEKSSEERQKLEKEWEKLASESAGGETRMRELLDVLESESRGREDEPGRGAESR